MNDQQELPLFGSDTRREAAESISAGTLREHCLTVLYHFGPLTPDEIAMKMHQSILAVRPRITELKALELIEDTGGRRRKASGRRAMVVRVKGGQA